jgi:hypothetical protein
MSKNIKPGDLLGQVEVGKMLGWTSQKVSVYLARGVFPEPVQRVKATPLWTRQQITAYRDSHLAQTEKAPTE